LDETVDIRHVFGGRRFKTFRPPIVAYTWFNMFQRPKHVLNGEDASVE